MNKDEKDIYDQENFESSGHNDSEPIIIEENNINSDDVYVESESYHVSDSYDEKDDIKIDESDNIDNKKMKRKRSKNKNDFGFKTVALMLAVSLLGGVIGGGAVYYSIGKDNKNNTVIQANPPTFKAEEGQLTKIEAFERVAKSVVIVSSKGTPVFNGFTQEQPEGIGSGFIINEEGYILTNYHVIEGAKDLTVTLSDKREVKAEVVNYDQNQDIAMIKIVDDIEVPAVAELGDSDALKAGEEVIAIGTPLSKDFSQTVTSGIVSAVNRTVETSTGAKLNLIQTDAAINPGNSGGPLVNTKGEVVGINTLKIASGEVEGLGFSIPINEVKGRIESLSKPILNLGVTIREVDENLAKQYNIPKGLYVVNVSEFSPAEKAGIKSGDVITKFDGKKVSTFEELKEIKDSKEEGDVVKVEIVRNNNEKVVDLQLTAKK